MYQEGFWKNNYIVNNVGGTASLKETNGISEIITNIKPLAELLDKKIFNDIKIIKIDTDGFDFEILLANKDIISMYKPNIYFEYDISFSENGNQISIELIKFLVSEKYMFIIYDNFGNLFDFIEDGAEPIFNKLNRYMSVTNKYNGGIYYFDILASTDYNLLLSVFNDEIKKIKQMKLLFDHQAFKQVSGGVSRSYVEILKRMNNKIEFEIALLYSKNLYIKQLLPKMSFLFNEIYFPYKRKIVNKLNFKYSILKLKYSKYDIFHATFDDSYFLPYVKTPYVITVHDLIPESEPENWPNEWLISRKMVFLNATHIVTVSYNTKKDLLLFFPDLIGRDKITVIHHGSPKLPEQYIQNTFGKYILYIGGRKGYKNFRKLILSIYIILHQNRELKLLCVGSELSIDEYLLLKKLRILDKVRILKVNEDFELFSIYKHAIFFVFPSLKEGFGIPILEAWSNDCPILLSNIKCFKEIANDAAIYFEPTDILSMRDKINLLLQNRELRQTIINNGRLRVQNFNWEESAEKLKRVYEKVLKTN